jgi:2-methylcitrate dehydratase PrpD
VQYCIARALTAGKVVFEHFEGSAYRDDDIVALLPRVRAAPHKPGQFAPDNNNGAVVEVLLTDGTRVSEKVERALGRTAQNPIALADLQAKFENCASRVLAPEAVRAAVRAIEHFEDVASIRDFTALLETAA